MALVVKNLCASTGDIRDLGPIPGLERSAGGGHGNPHSTTELKKKEYFSSQL